MEENSGKKRGRSPSPPSRRQESKISSDEPKKSDISSISSQSSSISSSSSNSTVENGGNRKSAPSLANLMANLAEKKKQLLQQTEEEKKRIKQNELLQKAVQVRSAIAGVKKDNLALASTPSSSASLVSSLPTLSSSGSNSSALGSNNNHGMMASSSASSSSKEEKEDDFMSFTPSLASLATLKVNQKAKQPKSSITVKTEKPAEKKKNLFIDPNIRSAASDRTKRSLHFLSRSDVKARLAKERGTPEVTEVKQEDAKPTFELTTEELLAKKPKEPLPEVEWWDKWLLEHESYDDLDKEQGVKLGDINIYVEHPIPIKVPGENDESIPVKMFLTDKETRRLRKQTRAERQKEKQERIIMGLEEAPPPKVKLSNLAFVLGAESSANPTAIENEVKRQTEARIAAHDARNAANKLSKEERKQKVKEKLVADAKHSTHVAVFKVKDLSHPQHKFKVDANAREFYMTGCAIISPLFSMVVVEGAEKAVRRFKKLMLSRIDWNKAKNAEGMEENLNTEAAKDNCCDLIWEGTLLKANFLNFRFESLPTEVEVRKYLNNRWSEHYWDMCKNFVKEE